MKCAIYCRKSTDENDKKHADKSVARQLAQARQFIKKQGWTVAEDHIDDGISGAEFDKRPGFQALLEAVKAKRVEAVVTMEPSRLGREMTMTAYCIRIILDAGVRIFYYSTGEEEKADTPTDRLVGMVKGYADEMERLKARQRVRDSHLHKAQQGFATHDAAYGYTTVREDGHSVFEIVPEKAEIVRRVFTMYARGDGYQRITKQLEEDEITPPRKGWWPGTVRDILRRELYIGKFVWGRTRKEDKLKRAGILVRQDPTVTMTMKHLRIVPQELWDAVHRRMRQEQATYIRDRRGRLMAKPEAGRAGKYLLAGFARCVVCQGGMIVKGSERRYYACVSHHLRGNKGCTNTLTKRIEPVDRAVLDYLANEILQPTRMAYIMAEVTKRLREEARTRPDTFRQKEHRKTKLHREVENLIQAAADGRPPQSLLRAIRDKEMEITTLDKELTASHSATSDDRELERDLALIEHDLAHIRNLLGGSVKQARQILKVFLPSRLIFTPDNGGYDIRGQCNLGGLLRFQNSDKTPRPFIPLFHRMKR